MPWPQYDLTTWKPALPTCALMMSPTSRKRRPGLTAAIALSSACSGARAGFLESRGSMRRTREAGPRMRSAGPAALPPRSTHLGRHADEPPGGVVDGADDVGLVQVAVEAVEVGGDVHVHDVAVLQRPPVWDAVADHLHAV